MSVGITTIPPARIAAIASSTVLIATHGPRRRDPVRQDPSSPDVDVAEPVEETGRRAPRSLGGLEHERAALAKHRVAARAIASVATLGDERGPRLPVAHLGLQRSRSRRAGRTAGSRRRGPRALPAGRRRGRRARARPTVLSETRSPAPPPGPPPTSDRRDLRARISSAIASAIAPLPVPTSSTRGSATPAIRARQRSTTTSVSGRGTSTRASTFSVSRRNPHSPST